VDNNSILRKCSVNGWNLLYYSDPMNYGNHYVTFKINKINKDKSGLIIGIMRNEKRETKLNTAKTNFIAISGKGFS